MGQIFARQHFSIPDLWLLNKTNNFRARGTHTAVCYFVKNGNWSIWWKRWVGFSGQKASAPAFLVARGVLVYIYCRRTIATYRMQVCPSYTQNYSLHHAKIFIILSIFFNYDHKSKIWKINFRQGGDVQLQFIELTILYKYVDHVPIATNEI